jgi:hypothetical protein
VGQGLTNKKFLAALGHHKCASTWIHRICERVCDELGLKVGLVYEETGGSYARFGSSSDNVPFDGDLERYVREQKVDFLLYGNADFQQVQSLPVERMRAFHYVRDPRDIVVSAYFSHRNSHPTQGWPELVEHRQKLRSCSKDEGLLLELEFRSQQFQEMRSWRHSSDNGTIRLYKFEDMTANPYQTVLEIFGHLGLLDREHYFASKRLQLLLARVSRRLESAMRHSVHLPPRTLRAMPAERLLGIVYEQDFSKLSGGRQKGEVDPNSHYRRGVHGDWINHFSLEHLQFFKEHYGDLVLQYGYESDPDWDRKYARIIRDRPKEPQQSVDS